jgi:hypothetical protein
MDTTTDLETEERSSECERCHQRDCCCQFLPMGWGIGAHPSYLAYAMRQRETAAAAIDRALGK